MEGRKGGEGEAQLYYNHGVLLRNHNQFAVFVFYTDISIVLYYMLQNLRAQTLQTRVIKGKTFFYSSSKLSQFLSVPFYITFHMMLLRSSECLLG